MNKEHIQELAEKIRNAICYLGMPTQEADKRTVELITQALNNQWVRVEDRLTDNTEKDLNAYSSHSRALYLVRNGLVIKGYYDYATKRFLDAYFRNIGESVTHFQLFKLPIPPKD